MLIDQSAYYRDRRYLAVRVKCKGPVLERQTFRQKGQKKVEVAFRNYAG